MMPNIPGFHHLKDQSNSLLNRGQPLLRACVRHSIHAMQAQPLDKSPAFPREAAVSSTTAQLNHGVVLRS